MNLYLWLLQYRLDSLKAERAKIQAQYAELADITERTESTNTIRIRQMTSYAGRLASLAYRINVLEEKISNVPS